MTGPESEELKLISLLLLGYKLNSYAQHAYVSFCAHRFASVPEQVGGYLAFLCTMGTFPLHALRFIWKRSTASSTVTIQAGLDVKQMAESSVYMDLTLTAWGK